jgi:probable O-glycosylation ligase (exosortase A-associated)
MSNHLNGGGWRKRWTESYRRWIDLMVPKTSQAQTDFGRRKSFTPTSQSRPILITAIIISVIGGLLLFAIKPEYIFGPILLIMLVAVIFKYPIAGLNLYLLIVYLRPQDLFGFLGVLRPNIFVLVLTIVSLVIHRKLTGKTHITLLRNDRLFLAFLVAAVLSNITSIWFSSSVETTIEILKISIFYFAAILLLDNTKRIVNYITLYLLSVGFVSLIQIYTYLTIGLTRSTGRGGYGIIVGGTTILGGGGALKMSSQGVNGVGGYSSYFMANASEFGLALVVAYPLCYYLFRGAQSRLLKILSLTLLAAFLVSIVFTGSRGAFVGLLATIIYLLLKEKKLIMGSVVLAMLAVPAYYLVSDSYVERIESISEYEEDESVGIRFQLWRAAIDMVADYPIFGIGTGNFPNAYGGTYRAKDSQNLYWSPHNVFIQIITEMGLVGFTIYILFIASIFWINIRTRKLLEQLEDQKILYYLTNGIDVILVGYIVAGQFITATYYPHLFQFSVWASAIYLIARRMVNQKQTASVT